MKTENISSSDLQSAHLGGRAMRRMLEIFGHLSPANKPVAASGVFVSAVLLGDGQVETVAHGLGSTPSKVWVTLVGVGGETSGYVSYGTHNATNVLVTVPANMYYQVIAIA